MDSQNTFAGLGEPSSLADGGVHSPTTDAVLRDLELQRKNENGMPLPPIKQTLRPRQTIFTSGPGPTEWEKQSTLSTSLEDTSLDKPLLPEITMKEAAALPNSLSVPGATAWEKDHVETQATQEKAPRTFFEKMKDLKEKQLNQMRDLGFKKYVARKASEGKDALLETSLAYKNLSFKEKAVITCGLVALSALTGGGAIPLVVGGSLKILGSVGIATAYVEKQKKEKGVTVASTTDIVKGAALASIVFFAVPQLFHFAGQGIEMLIHLNDGVATTVQQVIDTPAPELQTVPQTSPLPENIEVAHAVEPPDPSAEILTTHISEPAEPSEVTTPTPDTTASASHPTEVASVENDSSTYLTQEITIGRGDSLTSLMTSNEHFAELKELTAAQKTNVIQNVISTVSRNPELMAKLGLPNDLWLTEGRNLDLTTLHEIIKNTKVNGMSLIERAKLL